MTGSPRWCLDFVDWRALVTERWKYAFYETGTEMLFDLEADPYELEDLSARNPARRDELRALLLEALRQTREPFFDVIIEHGVPCPTPRNVSGVEYRILWQKESST